MKGFRQGTNRNSETMDIKYGDISIELREFRKTVKEFLNAFLSELKDKNHQ